MNQRPEDGNFCKRDGDGNKDEELLRLLTAVVMSQKKVIWSMEILKMTQAIQELQMLQGLLLLL